MREPSNANTLSAPAPQFDLPPIVEIPRFTPRAVCLNDKARGILNALLDEIETFGRREQAEWGDVGWAGRLGNFRRAGVPYRPAVWFGGPLHCAARKAYSRAARRLDWAGLVWRIMHRRRDRVAYLQLTAAGLRRALELRGFRVDREALAEGFRRTMWGADLAAEVLRDQSPVVPLPVGEAHESSDSP